MWFDNHPEFQIRLGRGTACCTEIITEVAVKGTAGKEKVFVTIQRHIGVVKRRFHEQPLIEQHPSVNYPVTIVEERNIVYFRKKTPANEEPAKPDKILLRTTLPSPLSPPVD